MFLYLPLINIIISDYILQYNCLVGWLVGCFVVVVFCFCFFVYLVIGRSTGGVNYNLCCLKIEAYVSNLRSPFISCF